jgi:hypothetical protein|uniref:hypothetical protein n=1 Tax=Prosthecobacter sp. TaxID=1965333 RepID=UPI003784D486
MLLKQIEEQIAQLSPEELKQFSAWFDEYTSDEWDRQIERDEAAGKFDKIIKQLDANFEGGLCTPL